MAKKQSKDNLLSKSWKFLKTDSWASLIVTLIIAFVIIKFVFFPLLSFFTGTTLPLVIVESCSMYHTDGLEDIFTSPVYEDYDLGFEDASDWAFKKGINKGDVIFVVGVDSGDDLEIGDVIIFSPTGSSPHPIIHRVISLDPIATKGDHNSAQLKANNNPYRTDETNIKEEQIIGKAVFRVPYIGWGKLVFFEPFRNTGDVGLCD